MKTVILMRHSKPLSGLEPPNGEIPLCEEGISSAKKLFQSPLFVDVQHLWASPYRRAYDTAKVLNDSVLTDPRLRERELGDPATLNAEFWGRQYREHSFKNSGGESLNDVKLRMTAFMDELLHGMNDGEKAVVVSHAAAICSYLLNFCSITVSDEEKKWRHISFRSRTVLNGSIATPSAFVLTFDGTALNEISYFEC